jgi:MarR family transcriptional regulator, lower aerobic nicotinate degradation pathway regulator
MFDIEQSVVFALSKASQRVSAVFKEEFKDYGITPGQFILLAMLWKTDGLSLQELTKRTRIDRTTLGGITDRLEGAGFLVRKTSAEDHRAHQVWLTDQGRFFERDLGLAAYRVRRKISERLAPAEYKQLKLLLNKLLTGTPIIT